MTTAQSHNRPRPVRSFVRREGRITTGQQRALDTLLPRFSVDEMAFPLELDSIFSNTAPVTLEIGFGDGQSLLEMAKQAPEINFLGVEVYRPGVGKLLLGVESDKVSNVRVSVLDAVDLVQRALVPQSLARILIFYPDPWPKKKHHKRRLVQPEFIDTLCSRLEPQGVLHLATDIQSYAEHAMEILEACESLRNTAGAGNYAERPEYRPPTKYERRGLKLGHPVFDLVFRSTS